MNEHERKYLTRRNLLKLAVVGAGGLLLCPDTAAASESAPSGDSAAMLYDATRCVGCRECEAACKKVNNLPPNLEHPTDLDGKNLTLIKQYQGVSKESFVKLQCMHCEYPACVSACPVQALQKTEEGPVTYDSEKCIGCRYCMMACPFHVPRVDWYEVLPEIKKCTFCVDRIDDGLIPACAEACPVGALSFGTRNQMLQEARSRIEQEPERYLDHVYGEQELGGTSWLYLSAVPFDDLGLPEYDSEPRPDLSENVAIYGTPTMLAAVAAMLGGLGWAARGGMKPTGPDSEKDEEK
ncbi:MAG: 4Fe-4S dicluster domain-containing protein [Anaerolineales bacterium]|nr:4Fe-4S dicluster domain-containing protein [Anaerolineales bacterium]